MTMQKSHSCANRSHRILLSKGLRSALAWVYFAMPFLISRMMSELKYNHRNFQPFFHFCFFTMSIAVLSRCPTWGIHQSQYPTEMKLSKRGQMERGLFRHNADLGGAG